MAEILFLAHRVPWPADRGDKIRSHHLLRYLGARHRVHLVAFTEGESHASAIAALEPLAASISLVRRTKSRPTAVVQALARGKPASLTAFHSVAMEAMVREVLDSCPIEAAFVFSSQMAQHVAGFAGPLIMDFVDVDAEKFRAYADAQRGPMRWLLQREAARLLAHDRAVAARAAASLFVSEAEAALFRRLTGAERVHAIGNGIDTDLYDPAAVDPAAAAHPLIVFTGQMDYRPNMDAVIAFADGVLPGLPDATFAIVGRNPVAPVRALAERPNVIVTGEVPDTRPWLAAADVVVAPLGIARGVQNKVLEAMAMARPVVASPEAAEGIDHGGTIRVAGPDQQAAAIAALLADRAAADALGLAARQRVVSHYAWNAQLAPLDALLP